MSVRSLRLGGLATGLDIDQMVKDLMRVERVPLDKLRQDRQISAWRKQEWRDLNKSMAFFRDQVFTMRLQSTYMTKKAISSNASTVSVTALSTAAEGQYILTVQQKAKGAYVASDAALADEKDASGNTKKLKDQFSLAEGTIISFTLEGSTKNQDGTFKQASFSFNVDEKTIYDVVNEINQAGLGFKAVYDNANDRFVLMSPTTGSAQRIKVVADSSNFLSGMDGQNPDNKLKLKITAGTEYTGQDAKVKLNGSAYDFASNSFTLMGLQVTLNGGPETLGEPEVSANISVSLDSDAVFNSIKGFIEKYNEQVDKLTGKLREERFKDYPPLNDEQRKQLTDKEIDLWEEKAKSGLLRNDPLLDSIINRFRSMTTSSVSEITTGYKNLADIGIKTGNYTEGGKLFIDEAKLKEAIARDAEGVMNLFTQTNRKTNESWERKGIAYRLYDEVNSSIKKIVARAGSATLASDVDQSFLGKEIQRFDQRVKDMERRIQRKEDAYWRQFTTLEKAMAKFNAQSTWLANQFSGGNK